MPPRKSYQSENPEEHVGLVGMCARRLMGRGIPYEELYQQGCVGLMNAAARFDPSRGVCFSTYAVPLILFEMKRYADTCTPMHVPRTDRELQLRVSHARARLMEASGREPTVTELAQALRMPPEELGARMEARERMNAISAYEEGLDFPAAAATDPQGESFVDTILLWDAIERLPAPMPELIWLRYVKRLSQKRVGQLLQLTQVQVSRLERRTK
ncbi:MAG: sigma-70 family RNA polymerase sigma factor, partial [Clostridia bacterium]|nr:sigma-70 family RNA polymerase sigma factor [Clostridia bacterium]